jgi:uridine kinase
MADELVVVLRQRGRHVIRAWVDDFLRPRCERYRRGQYSAQGCYQDAFDYPALTGRLLAAQSGDSRLGSGTCFLQRVRIEA